jgi:protein-S-isoprenylcysteine O-methyltransferase Ste14
MSAADATLRPLIRRRIIQVVISIVLQGAILFTAAGSLAWPMAWAFIGVNVGFVITNALVLIPRNPEVVAERAQMKKGAKSWDKVLAPLMAVLGPLLMLGVAGLDVRFEWSGALAPAVHVAGFLGLVLGYALIGRAMLSNTFFSGLVRIQKERGHTVVTSGPYEFVRHPGYLGMITATIATPVALGTLWALVPAGVTVVLTVVRTALEDKTLRNELDGYVDYSLRVRSRLVPRVW